MTLLRPEGHEIEDAAERIFADQLPRSWVAEPYRKDYGVDFRIDVFDGNKKTGISFGVQLKGVRSPLITNGKIRYSIEVRHLSHYVDDERQPIYLVIVDVTRRQSYWIFLQRHAIERLKKKRWRTQKTVSIEIPLWNALTDSDRLMSDVYAADAFMCSFRPGALPVSYAAELNRLSSIDPRFDFELSGKNGQLGWHLSPRVPVELTLTVDAKSEDARQRLKLAVEGQQSVEFKSHEISIAGSPLFDNQQFDLSITTFQRGVDISVELYECEADDRRFICNSNGSLHGNDEFASVVVPFEESPFEWKFSFEINKAAKEAKVKSSLVVDFEHWIGKDVLRLPYFMQAIALSRAVRDGSDIYARFCYQGNQLFVGLILNSQILLLGEILEALTHLENLRSISKASGATIVAPKELGESDESDAKELGALIERKLVKVSRPHARLNARVPRSEALRLSESMGKEKYVTVKLEGPREYKIGEFLFKYTPCNIIMSHMGLADANSFAESLAKLFNDEIVDLELAALEENQITVEGAEAQLSFTAASDVS